MSKGLQPAKLPRVALRAFTLGALLAGIITLAWGSYIPAKAWLSQVLLRQAWAGASQEEPARPWPWADFTAEARLQVPSQGVDQIVLSGHSDATLAFGPGLRLFAKQQAKVLAGHRDTHFKYLANLKPGDELIFAPRGRAKRSFRVSQSQVIDLRNQKAFLAEGPSLILVTCYPFDGLEPNTPYRYVVEAYPTPFQSERGPE